MKNAEMVGTRVHDICDALPGGRLPSSLRATSGYPLAILRIARGWQEREALGGGLSFSARLTGSPSPE